MTTEQDIARLERQVLGASRVRSYLDAVDELRRLLAREDPGIRARVLKLTAPRIGRDLAAAVSAAYDIGLDGAYRLAGLRSNRAPRQMPATYVIAAREVERDILTDVAKARRLARADADDATVMSVVSASANRMRRAVVTLVNQAGNAGATAAADSLRMPTVWVAEINACVDCLRYSGEVTEPGERFPAGLTYGAKPKAIETMAHPPLHGNCRCTVEPLNDPSYAAALRREADRSVLRGFSLESESMSTRVDAAERLIARGVDAPKSVIEYARNAVKRGEFTTRGRP